MEALKEAIRREGSNLGDGILKIDGILNHQAHPNLMTAVGIEIAQRFSFVPIDRVLTAEVSGIIPALTAAQALGVPFVYARKVKPITMRGPVYLETAPSHTKGGEVTLLVSAEFLHPGENVLIVDDFLATGLTLAALARIVWSAKSNLVGMAVVVEKSFENGRTFLASKGVNVPIIALATVTSMENGNIHVE